MISLTRLYRFSASHRLHSPLLSGAENVRVYGKCNNPYGHGHDYVFELSIAGELDPVTGLLLPLAQLDRFVDEKILRLFAHRNINLDVPEFASVVPTTENVLSVIAGLIERDWPESFAGLKVRVTRVHLQETDRNGFELSLPAPKIENSAAGRSESVMVHA
jgi:6-pyruvoyltetrahydropterin/6-carboxytetrahydropterin synthase